MLVSKHMNTCKCGKPCRVKYCSRKCFGEGYKGTKLTPEHRQKLSIRAKSIKRDVNSLHHTYENAHIYIRKHKGNPHHCEFCGLIGKKDFRGKWNIEYANLTQKPYSYDLRDYIGLCVNCHRQFDANRRKSDN